MRWVLPFFGFALGLSLLVLLELAVRILFPGPLTPYVTHPVLNHTWRPNSEWTHTDYVRKGIAPYLHRYNDQAWIEEYSVAEKKPPGTFRIFYLGDSFTEGTCPMEQSVPSQVEKLLGEKGRKVEVVNTGTTSYSPALYYLLLKSSILRYAPDLIVVNVDMTDVFDDYLYSTTAQYDATGELVACPPESELKQDYIRTAEGLAPKSKGDAAVNFLRTHSRLFERMYWIIGAMTQRKGKADPSLPGQFDWAKPERSEATQKLVEKSMEHLRALILLAKKHGIQVAVTGVPHLENFTGEFSEKPFEEIRKVATEAGAVYVDSFGGIKALLGEVRPQEIYIPNDMHFNERGYAFWAQVEAKALQEDFTF